jgi:hypothetical protein
MRTVTFNDQTRYFFSSVLSRGWSYADYRFPLVKKLGRVSGEGKWQALTAISITLFELFLTYELNMLSLRILVWSSML